MSMSDPTVTGFNGERIQTCSSSSYKLSTPESGSRDDDYVLIPKLSAEPQTKRGSQCGECGMKFEYGKNYGFHCGSYRCPMGFGWP